MSKIVVDVALLVTDEVADICIKINSKKESKAYVVLNKQDNLSRITLAMGVVDEKDLPIIKSKITEISKKHNPFNLEIDKIYSKVSADNEVSCCFDIKPIKKILDFQREIMKELFPLFSYDVSSDMFYKDHGETIAEVSKVWVENYCSKYYKPTKYHPHISLKCRKVKYDKLPIQFTASKLALCHLGNYCTCRKVLFSEELE